MIRALLLLCALSGAAQANPLPVDRGQEEPPEAADPPVSEPPLLDPPAAEVVQERTNALSTQLRCPVCQGLSVAASPSEAARAMRSRIEDLVAQGYTDEQVTDYFVGRYGTWVLLDPPKEGVTLGLWLGPLAVVLGGLGVIALRSRRPAAAAPTAGAPTDADATPPGPEPARSEADVYRDRILAELEDRPKEQR